MSDTQAHGLFGPQHLSETLPKVRPPSRIKQRLIESAVEIEANVSDSITYQHTVFCQTGLPYRDPGHIRLWKRSQGAVHLEVEAGRAFHPAKAEFVDVGLPFGAKPRLILAYLNGEALKTGSPVIEVEESLTAFVQRIGLCGEGRTIRTVKDQLSRLAASEVRLALTYGDQQSRQVNAHIVGEFDLWFPKDAKQRVLWPTTVTLDPRYFESLQRHAVPLDERAVAALSHSAMGLDIYAWVAQRLHRVEPGRPAFIPWRALKEQFGHQYGRMDNFKRVFRQTLDMVLSQYRAARMELDGRGMTLRNSPPPIKGRTALIRPA
jgi:replication initiator protein